jgi:hypothetical protein
MKFFRTAKTVISPFLEVIARIFDLAGSIEKPQIFAFRLNLRFYYHLRRDRDYAIPRKSFEFKLNTQLFEKFI